MRFIIFFKHQFVFFFNKMSSLLFTCKHLAQEIITRSILWKEWVGYEVLVVAGHLRLRLEVHHSHFDECLRLT